MCGESKVGEGGKGIVQVNGTFFGGLVHLRGGKRASETTYRKHL